MTSTTPSLSRAQRFGASSGGNRFTTPAPKPRPVEPQVPSEVVVGILERLTKVSDTWAIGKIYSDERKMVSVVGACLVGLEEGNEYTFTGQPKHHPKFGEQIDVFSAVPFLRPDRKSIVKYIIKNFKGVGPTTAEKFIDVQITGSPDKDAALEGIRRQLLDAPWTLDFSAVTKRATYKVSEDEESPVLAYVHRDLATKLGGMPGMKDSVLKTLAAYLLKLHTKEGDKKSSLDPQIIQKCWASLIQDPYEPTKSVPGYAFTTADVIGASVNIPRDAPVRLKALVAHALDVGCQRGGHVYLEHAQLKAILSKIDSRVPIQEAIQYGLESDMIIADDAFGSLRYYTPKLHDAEAALAQGIATLCKDDRPLSNLPREQLAKKVQEVAKAIAPQMKNGLDQSQVDALVGILTSKKRLHTLTAGPGCGKTQLMEILSKVLEHKDIVFCGPTGKSAKVLANRLEAQGRSASTIHSTLMGSGRGSFRYNAVNQLDGDILCGDETSMDDVELAESLVAAVNGNMHLILLGDDNQLPSIAPGAFLRDLLKIREADHHRLTKTHRNSGGILDVIEQVRQGYIECTDLPGVTFSHGLGQARDEFSGIAQKYISAVSKHGYEGVALLMSLRAGDPDTPEWNVTYSNQVLRDLCNPHAVKIPGSRLYVGDRILIKDNMMVPIAGTARDKPITKKDDTEEDESATQARIVNGDTGSIVSFEKNPNNSRDLSVHSVCIKLDDGRLVDYPGSEVKSLQHSYALTVHSAQGSEYKEVIAVVTPGHASFINRTMMFTKFSRAQAHLDINGDDQVLRRIAATPMPDRNSALVDRVNMLLEADVDGDSIEAKDSAPVQATSRSQRFSRQPPPAKDPTELSLRERYAMRQRS